MTQQAKIAKIVELRKQMEIDFYTGNWKRYNESTDTIGKLNRSMMKLT